MNGHQERVLQSFRRVQGFLAANAEYAKADQAKTPALAAQLQALNGIVERAMDHATRQYTQLARALRGTIPGIGVLTMPKGNIQSASLITAASAMARKAEIYAPVLIEH